MATTALTHRERLARTLRFQTVDRVPDYEFSLWQQTTERWRQEGLQAPPGADGAILNSYFGTDQHEFGPQLATNVRLLPAFERRVLEDKGTHFILQDVDGAISDQMKPEYGASIPRYLRFAIETRADWVKLRDERLDPNHPERLPPYLKQMIRRLQHADYPVTVHCGSLYGWLRNWMGVENLSLMIYDDPPFVEEMMEHLTQLTLTVLGKLAGKGLRIDRADWWEDMCYNHGPLLSPRIFTELMVPRYKRITDYLRQEFGCEFNQLDCDGNIHELVPLWQEGGINVMFPIEVAHTDAYVISQQFGTRAPLVGAFDKRALIAGPQAIDAELERIRPLFARGGFIPHTDHLVPPDVSLESYIYYRRKKCEFIGKEWSGPGLRPVPGHIRRWQLAGPYPSAANAGFHAHRPPEPGAGEGAVAWREHSTTDPTGYVNLAAIMGRPTWQVAYARCTLHVEREGDGWLEMGSDDGLKAWLNGEQVWSKDAYRAAWPRQDVLPVRLRKGRNELLLKIGQAEGEWGFYARLSDDTGRAMPASIAGA